MFAKKNLVLFLMVSTACFQISSMTNNSGAQEKEAVLQKENAELKLKLNEKNERMVKALITLLGTMGAMGVIHNAFPNNERAIGNFTGSELEFVVGFTGLFWALRNWGIDWAGELAKDLPLAALSLKVVNTNKFQNFVKRIPVVGDKIGCTTGDRLEPVEGTPRGAQVDESNFQLRRGLQTIFVYTLLKEILPFAYKKGHAYFTNFFKKPGTNLSLSK